MAIPDMATSGNFLIYLREITYQLLKSLIASLKQFYSARTIEKTKKDQIFDPCLPQHFQENLSFIRIH